MGGAGGWAVLLGVPLKLRWVGQASAMRSLLLLD